MKTKKPTKKAFPKPVNTGGPAFPYVHYKLAQLEHGMTIRDYFAAHALQGYAANARIMDKAIDDWKENGGNRPICIAEFLSGLSYEVADKMILEREKPSDD